LDFSDYPEEWPKINIGKNACKPFSGVFMSRGQGVVRGEPRVGRLDILLGTLLGDDVEKIKLVYSPNTNSLTAFARSRFPPSGDVLPKPKNLTWQRQVICKNGFPTIKEERNTWGSGDGGPASKGKSKIVFFINNGDLIVYHTVNLQVKRFLFGVRKVTGHSWLIFSSLHYS